MGQGGGFTLTLAKILKIMKKHLLSAFLLASLVSMAQAPAIQWEKSLGGTLTDKGNAVQQTSDGGYIVGGETGSTNGDVTVNNGTTDYWVAKLDANGLLVWQKSLGGSGDDRCNAIIQTSDGGYLAAGTSNSPVSGDITAPKGQYDFWIVKLSSTGTVSWQKSLGGTAIDEARAVQQTSDGGFIIVGDTRSNNMDVTVNNGNTDFWVVKTDGSGVIQWQKSLGGGQTENAYSVHQTSDGGYIVAGQTNSTNGDVTNNNGGVDYWVTKLSSTGTLQWQKCLGGTLDDIAYSVKQTTDGGYIVAGTAGSNNGNVTGNNGAENAWVVKLTSTGTITWQECYGGPVFDGARSIQQTSDGGYVFAGTASSNSVDVSGNHGSNDYWVVKTSSTGTLQWQKCLGGSSSDSGMGIQETSDNGYVIAGRASSSNGDITAPKAADDFWVVKLVGVPSGISNQITIENNISVYPNPGRGVFTISSTIGTSGLQVLNSAGQLVHQQTINDGRTQADLSALAKGIYMLQLTNGNNAIVGIKKLVIE